MKESTVIRKKEIACTIKGKNVERSALLELVEPPNHILVERKQAMLEKIWFDIGHENSFLNVQKPEERLMSLFSNKEKKLKRIYDEPSNNGDNKIINNEYKLFAKAVQLSQSFILIIDKSGFIEYANPYFQSISGYTQDELVGKEFKFLLSELASHEEYEEILDALEIGEHWSGELINTKKNGEWYIFAAKISPVSFLDEEMCNYIVVGHDITSFRENQIKLEHALENNSTLLSELHNRVKNNLTIISSIMQLQAYTEENEKVKQKLISSVGKVDTFAKMHEILFSTSSFTTLDLGSCITKIVHTVQEMFEIKNNQISVCYNIEPVILEISQAHLCILILNEVITNRYAKFKENSNFAATLGIKLKGHGNNVEIEIKDDLGINGDKNTDENKTLSHVLITALNTRLKGSYEYKTSEKGGFFSLVFTKVYRKTGNARLS